MLPSGIWGVFDFLALFGGFCVVLCWRLVLCVVVCGFCEVIVVGRSG